MKKWTTNLSQSPKEVLKLLESGFNSSSGFIFSSKILHNDSIGFKLHKTIHFGEQALYRNKVVVMGHIEKNNDEAESKLSVQFKQHYLIVLTELVLTGFGISLIVAGLTYSIFFLLPGVLIFSVIAVLNIWSNKRLKIHISQYKLLLSDMLGIK